MRLGSGAARGVGDGIAKIFGGECLKIGDLFAADHAGLSGDRGFQGILGRRSLAFSGARARAFLRVEAIGLDLFQSWHK
jgi:hypothetical protein